MPLVHVNGVEVEPQRLKDEQVFQNYLPYTDGEFFLSLRGQQYDLLSKSFEGHKDAKAWKKKAEMYQNALYRGVHGTSGNISITGVLGSDFYHVQNEISQAAKRMAFAGGSIDLKGRTHIGEAPIIDIPAPDCDQFMTYDERGIEDTNNARWKECYNNHYNSYRWQFALNQHLERSAHHLLYEFMTDKQAIELRPTKSWKVGAHQQAVSMISSTSKLSRSNIVEWHRLGIMRHNAIKGAGALPPLQTIETLFNDQDATLEKVLKAYKDPETGKYESVGIIPVAAYIIFACAAAIVSISGLIQVINKQEPTALDRLGAIAKPIFSSEGGDNFPRIEKGDTNNGGGEDTDNGGGKDDEKDDTKEDSFFDKYKIPLIVGGVGLAAYGLSK